MNLDQRPVTQPGFHGVPLGGVNAVLIGLHSIFQYGFCATTNPLKSRMALPLVPATALLFLSIDILGIGPAEAAAGLVIALGGCSRHERGDLLHRPTLRHGYNQDTSFRTF
jgi:hypothetical protein